MAYQLPDNIKGVQPINEATSVNTLDYPFFFVGFGSSAGAKAPLVSYSSDSLKKDILSFIEQVTGISASAASVSAQDASVVGDAEMVPVEALFDEMRGATVYAAVELECTGSEASVVSAVNSESMQGSLPTSVVKASNKNYLRIHTDIEKSAVISGSVSIVVEAENPTYGETTIYWREVDGKKYLDVTVRAVPCNVHISYLTPAVR